MNARTIGFDLHAINERGTTTSAFDYATYCQSILNCNVKLFYDVTTSHRPSVEWVGRSFDLIPYKPEDDFRKITEPYKLDAAYAAKAGWDDGRRAAADRNLVHVVFKRHHPHGDVYAAISKWLSDALTGGRMPYVPHIVREHIGASDMREHFKIPRDALVIGRHGGYNEFNVEFVYSAILEALEKRRNLWFVFFNTAPFCEHERVIFNGYLAPADRASFLNTIDVGMNARMMGESFGLANAECLSARKPVFAWEGGMDRNHVAMIPKKEWLYRRHRDLVKLLVDYEPNEPDQLAAVEAVEEFRPIPVMRKFEAVFLDGPKGLHARRPLFHKIVSRLEQDINKLRYKKWLSY